MKILRFSRSSFFFVYRQSHFFERRRMRRTLRLALFFFFQKERTVWFSLLNDPQPGVVRESDPWTAMCVRNVDVHVSCSSQVDAQLAAFFIDPRAK